MSSSPCSRPSSPNGPCRIGSTTSIGPIPAGAGSPAGAEGTSERLSAPGSSDSRAEDSICQAPPRSICTGTTSKRSGSSAATTDAADRSDTSCSELRPPPSTATLMRGRSLTDREWSTSESATNTVTSVLGSTIVPAGGSVPTTVPSGMVGSDARQRERWACSPSPCNVCLAVW